MQIISQTQQLDANNQTQALELLAETTSQPIACANWPESFSYRPEAEFRMTHNEEHLSSLHMQTIPEIKQLDANNLPQALELLAETTFQPIACVNWPEDFPYSPEAGFRMAHNGEYLFIAFTVNEECSMAVVTEDNGEVWTDSCVEFFLSLNDNEYYNFEFTCIGKALLGFRKERSKAEHAAPAIMQTIKRYATLGSENFKEKKLNDKWELVVAIPSSALFRHQIKSWNNLSARMNLYKCGDNLSKPHYLSWQPIDTPSPNFHVERCFVNVKF